jgi:hypothetical protein
VKRLACSWDGGKSWSEYPLPAGDMDVMPFAIISSGELLVRSIHSGRLTFYRLVRGTRNWQQIELPLDT